MNATRYTSAQASIVGFNLFLKRCGIDGMLTELAPSIIERAYRVLLRNGIDCSKHSIDEFNRAVRALRKVFPPAHAQMLAMDMVLGIDAIAEGDTIGAIDISGKTQMCQVKSTLGRLGYGLCLKAHYWDYCDFLVVVDYWESRIVRVDVYAMHDIDINSYTYGEFGKQYDLRSVSPVFSTK